MVSRWVDATSGGTALARGEHLSQQNADDTYKNVRLGDFTWGNNVHKEENWVPEEHHPILISRMMENHKKEV